MPEEHLNDWQPRAACKTAPGEIFFPDDQRHDENLKAAKVYCNMCPVQPQCLDYALTRNELGIWGGTTEPERNRITKRRDQMEMGTLW